MKVPRGISKHSNQSMMAYHVEQMAKAMSGNISFGQTTDNSDLGRNIDGWDGIGLTPGAPNTQFAVTHGLGRMPKGFFTLSVDQPGAMLYKGVTAWTTGQIFLKCNVASVNFTIFIV